MAEQLEHGLVESVAEVGAGDELVTAAAAGATTLALGDAVDFDEDGGVLSIGAEVLDYSSADLDTDVLVLASPTTLAYEVGEPVLVYPPAPERVATVRLDEDGEAVDARVPHALYDRIPEGIREPDMGERVSLTLDGAAWVVADVLGKEPSIDGSYVDLTGAELPSGTDGLPPATSPTPTVMGGVGVLHVRWPGITNPDAVTYEVHLSTSSGFTPSGATLVATTPGTAVTLRTLPNGTALAYDTTYYVRLVAFDADPGAAAPSAEGSGSLYRVGNTEISAEYAYVGTLSADAITSGTIDAAVTVSGEFKTADSGRRVVMDALGLHLFSSTGSPLVDLPTDPTKPAEFKGNATITNLTASTLALTGAGAVQAGAGLELQQGLTSPASGPTVTLDHEVGATALTALVPTGATDGSLLSVPGLAFAGGNAYLSALSRTSANYTLTRCPANGGAPTASVQLATSTVPHVLAVDSADGTLWAVIRTVPGNTYTLRQYNATTLAATGVQKTVTLPTGNNIHVRGLGIVSGVAYVVWWEVLNPWAYGKVTTVNLSSGAQTAYTMPSTYYGVPASSAFGAATVGTFDYGDGIVRVAADVGSAWRVWTMPGSGTTLVARASDEWTSGIDGGVGTKMDPVAYDPTSGRLRQTLWEVPVGSATTVSVPWKQFTGVRESGQWWASYAWRDSDATGAAGTSLTDQGRRTGFTMQQRYRITLASDPIPDTGGTDDPNSVTFYLGKGSTDPGRTGMWQQAAPADGVTTAVVSAPVFSGTNPAATNDFPGSTPAYLRSSGKRADGAPKVSIEASGAANIDGLLPPGSITMWAGGAAPTGWLLCQGQALNTATSPDLFAAIGYTYGGSGTTFYLPDLRDRFPGGAGTTRALGSTGGSDTVTMPDHSHGSGDYATGAAQGLVDQTAASGGAVNLTTRGSVSAHTHNVNGTSGLVTGTNPAIANVPKYVALNFIIKS